MSSSFSSIVIIRTSNALGHSLAWWPGLLQRRQMIGKLVWPWVRSTYIGSSPSFKLEGAAPGVRIGVAWKLALWGTPNTYVGDGVAFGVGIGGLLGRAMPLLDSTKALFASWFQVTFQAASYQPSGSSKSGALSLVSATLFWISGSSP